MLLDVRIAVFTHNEDLYEHLSDLLRDLGIPAAQFSCNDRLDALDQWGAGSQLIALFDGSEQPQACVRWIQWFSQERANVASVWLDSELTREHVAEAMRAGARDLLIGDIQPSDLESLVKRLGFERSCENRTSRVVAALGAAGGAGVTTLVTNLAVEIANQERVPVAILDLDPLRSGAGLLLNIRPTRTLYDIRSQIADLDLSTVLQTAATHASGVSLVAAQGWTAADLPIPEPFIRKVIVLMQQIFPYLLIDVPRSIGIVPKTILHAAEAVLLVGQYSMSAAAGMRCARQVLEELEYPSHRILMAANSVSEPAGLSIHQWTQYMSCEPFAEIPFDPAVVNQAAADGNSISEVSGRAAITKSIQKMAEDLCNRLRGPTEAVTQEPRRAGSRSRLREPVLVG